MLLETPCPSFRSWAANSSQLYPSLSPFSHLLTQRFLRGYTPTPNPGSGRVNLHNRLRRTKPLPQSGNSAMSELLWYQAAVTLHQDGLLASPLPLPHPCFPHVYDSAHSVNHLPKNPHLKSASGQPSLKQLRGLNEIAGQTVPGIWRDLTRREQA